jgi:hypothetical protein
MIGASGGNGVDDKTNAMLLTGEKGFLPRQGRKQSG